MKNLLTQWELKRKTDHKLGPLGYRFLVFLLDPLVGGWPRFCLVLRDHRGSEPSWVGAIVGRDHRGSGPWGVEPLWVKPSWLSSGVDERGDCFREK